MSNLIAVITIVILVLIVADIRANKKAEELTEKKIKELGNNVIKFHKEFEKWATEFDYIIKQDIYLLELLEEIDKKGTAKVKTNYPINTNLDDTILKRGIK